MKIAMTLEGTVVSGVVVPDGGSPLPEDARVRIELTTDNTHVPAREPGTREEELAALRESLEDAKAGRTRPTREVLKEIAQRHNLPLEPGE